jgi:hypothetical protein
MLVLNKQMLKAGTRVIDLKLVKPSLKCGDAHALNRD